MLRLLFLGLACCLAIIAAAETANPPVRETLLWAQTNAPPFFITEGPLQGKGFSDPVQRILEEELPEFDHITHVMPLRRLLQFWKSGSNYCFASMIHHPPRDDSEYILSIPNVLYRPHGIIVKADNSRVEKVIQNRIDKRGAISVEHFFKAPDIRFGWLIDRSSGPRVNSLLQKYKDRMQIYQRSNVDGLDGLFNMLKHKRVDYLIDYPFVFDFYDEQPAYRGLFQLIPIAENLDLEIWGSIACTKNAWGNARIQAINGAIARLTLRDDYRRLVVKWHAAEGDEIHYWNKLTDAINRAAISFIPPRDSSGVP